jgi:hypothetical protein
MKAVILAFLLSLPVSREDVHDSRKELQLASIAIAIDEAATSPQEAAMLIATGYHESHFSLRIHAGNCRPDECDAGRVRGPWQVQRHGMRAEEWNQMHGLGNTRAQALAAQKRLIVGQVNCRGSAYGALVRYLGLRCHDRSNKVRPRFELYERALNAIRTSAS